MIKRTRRTRTTQDSSLQGQLLLAMPTMTDKRFQRSVILMCRHSDEGAMGIIVNQRADGVTLATLLQQLDILAEDALDSLPAALKRQSVHVGGPVSAERGFVLHSADHIIDDSTLMVCDGICLTATVDILKAIAAGAGPRQSILALGYAGWAPGQLEREIQANGWLHCPADRELVFGDDIESTYVRALSSIGVDPTVLVGTAGHA
jgi:putative transcriptional regulator